MTVIHAKFYYLARWHIKLVLIIAAANRIARNDRRLPNNLIWQYYLSDARFVVQFASWRNRTFKMADKFDNSSHFFSIYNSSGPARFSSSSAMAPFYFLFHGADVQNQLTHYIPSPVVPQTGPLQFIRRVINCIFFKRIFLFRINIARINTREVIESASSPAIFESCALL